MRIAKRLLLFFAINALVVITISIVLNLLNVRPFLTSHGLDYSSLMIFCLVWGMGGALISLSLSRMMAKWLMGVHIIDPNTDDPTLQHLVFTIHNLSQRAGLPEMPQVGVYESPEVNAFATGPSKRRSLVAVSRGLLQRMSQKELEGVLAHELTHIANGDMVTMTLLQGVVNAFVMFMARVLAFALAGRGGNNRQQVSRGGYMALVFVFELVFMVLGMLVIATFSRWREFRADAGGADLAGKGNMIAALKSLKALQERRDPRAEQPSFQALKISTTRKSSAMLLFSTHPPLEERIARLEQI